MVIEKMAESLALNLWISYRAGVVQSDSHTWAAVFALAFLLLALVARRCEPSKIRSGPTGIPLLGNLLQVYGNSKTPVESLEEMHKQYGDAFWLQLGQQRMFVLGSAEAVHHLVNRSGGASDARPSWPLLNNVPSDAYRLLTMHVGPYFYRVRLLVKSTLQQEHSSRRWQTAFERESVATLRTLADADFEPERILPELRRFTFSSSLTAIFNRPVPTSDHHLMQAFDRFSADIVDLFGHVTNVIPLLQWLPWTGWTRRSRALKLENLAFWSALVNEAEASPESAPLFAQLSEHNRLQDLSLEQKAMLFEQVTFGASDTLSHTLGFLMLGMALNQSFQREAQAEVDNVCSSDLPPTYSDLPHLHRVNALVEEALRWRPSTATVMHSASQPLHYKDAAIPAGTPLIINHWALRSNPAHYPNPDRFHPSRYLGDRSAPAAPVFGAGRRICPGQRLAKETMVMFAARLLWLFSVERHGSVPAEYWQDAELQKPDSLSFSRVKEMPITFEVRDRKRLEALSMSAM